MADTHLNFPSPSLRLLGRKEVSDFFNLISGYYGVSFTEISSDQFYINPKGKVYAFSGNKIPTGLHRINSFGLYIGTFHDEKRFRLSVDGARYIIPKKNFLVLDEKSFLSYVSCENLFISEVSELNYDGKCPFLIVLYKGNRIGCVSVKGDMLLNYLPKGRRLDFNKVF